MRLKTDCEIILESFETSYGAGQFSWGAGNRSKTRGVIAGLVPAIAIRIAQCPIIGMAGTSPAMTEDAWTWGTKIRFDIAGYRRNANGSSQREWKDLRRG